jgi:phosphate/sulfate permease
MERFLTVAAVVSGLFFGWTIGAHYTGATMGMAYGAGVIRKRSTALLLIAVFVVAGATFESHNVVTTVGTGIIPSESMTPLGAMVMMLTAALVTAANTWMKWPVSTSQLACFSVVGAALGMHAPINWGTTVLFLFITWIGTPIISAVLGFIFTRLADSLPPRSNEKVLRPCLLIGCCYAAYTLGANNTGNAVGVFYGLKLATPVKAGFIGGIVMAIGAITWGKGILEKVGKGIVEVDLNIGVAAKLAQSITAHTSSALGYPTSMNQALIGGVAGASGARGLKSLNRKALSEIVFSWFFTPFLAGLVSFLLYVSLSRIFAVK